MIIIEMSCRFNRKIGWERSNASAKFIAWEPSQTGRIERKKKLKLPVPAKPLTQ